MTYDNHKVLIVGRRTDDYSPLIDTLGKEGIHVFTASSPLDAAAVIRVEKPGLILADGQDSDNSIYDFCKSIADNWAYKPTILATCKGDNLADRIRFYTSGAVKCFTNPLDVDYILDCMLYYLTTTPEPSAAQTA